MGSTIHRVDALLQYFTPNRNLGQNLLTTDLLSILDSYTDGHYESSALASAEILRGDPELYELYYIYIRSLDYMGQPFSQIFPPASVAATILEHSNVIIRGEKSYRNSLDQILKLSGTLWRDSLAYALYDFYAEERLPEPDKSIHKLALLNATQVNPRFATIYEDFNKAKEFLDEAIKPARKSSTLSLMSARTVLSHCTENLELSPDLPETRRRIYSAEIHEAEGRPQSAIADLQPLLPSIAADKLPGGFYSCHRITRALFRCYLDTKQLAECTDMVVRFFLRDDR